MPFKGTTLCHSSAQAGSLRQKTSGEQRTSNHSTDAFLGRINSLTYLCLGSTRKTEPWTQVKTNMNEIPNDSEKCEACGKVDKLDNMRVTHEDVVLCENCNDMLTAQVEAATENYEPETM